ncbi:alpha-xylosidase [Bacteroidia bacterium]|nr:alpha-xylosidase [Bacteroidia bacterium]
MSSRDLLLALTAALAVACGTKTYKSDGCSVSFENLKINVLTPTMFSVQQGSGFRFATPKTDLGVANLEFPKTNFTIGETDGIYSIVTDSLTIIYSPQLPLDGGGICVALKNDRQLEQLGQKDTLNLGGVIGAMDNCDGNKSYSEQNDITSSWHYRNIPDGLLSRRGFTVIRHTADTLCLYGEGERFDELYVLAYGGNYRQAFSDFYSLSGAIPMLPKWSLGFIYSRWKDYTDADYKDIAARFRREKLPLDAIILDMCWHVDYWYGYRYDTINFPDMKGFQQWADSEHLKVGFNHHSGCIYHLDPKVKEFCQRAGLDYDKALEDGLPWEPERKNIRYDTRNERHFKAFYDLYLDHMIKDGFDFHWVDGDNSIYSSELYQKYLSQETGLRPLVLNRLHEGVMCNHRYPCGFSGDTYATWATMRYTLEATIKGGNNGVYWSHDTGGYMPQGKAGKSPDGEMFARWFQLGAFSPIMRAHAKKDVYWWPPVLKKGDRDGGSRLPWDWGEDVLDATRTAMQLRAALLPYIYTMSRNAHDSGLPICRGLYIDSPDSDEAYRYDEYMFGDDFFVAPVLDPSGKGEKGIASRSLYLPRGEWYDFFTGERLPGDRQITVNKPLSQMPLYVKAGSIIPMAPYRDYGSQPLDTLCLAAYTPQQSGKTTFLLYEDDGQSFNFLNNGFRRIALDYEYVEGASQKITVNAPEGDYLDGVKYRAYRMSVINTDKPGRVLLDGLPANDWMWDASTRRLTVATPSCDINKQIILEIKL